MTRCPALLLFLLLMPFTLAAAEKETPPELFFSSGCRGCHLFDGRGGTVGPALDQVGRRFSSERLARIIRDPRSANPKAKMPAYDHLTPTEIATLADFLSRRK